MKLLPNGMSVGRRSVFYVDGTYVIYFDSDYLMGVSSVDNGETWDIFVYCTKVGG